MVKQKLKFLQTIIYKLSSQIKTYVQRKMSCMRNPWDSLEKEAGSFCMPKMRVGFLTFRICSGSRRGASERMELDNFSPSYKPPSS